MIEAEFEYNNKKITVDVPHDFICVISRDIMNDPVILSDGHSYERNCVIEWFKLNKNISPKTGAQLANKHILQNYALKGVINEIKKEIYDKKLNEQISELEKQYRNGDSCATYKLGLMYKDGIGLVVQNYDRAREYFERAEQLGNYEAAIYLAKLYSDELIGVGQDYAKALRYYVRAIELGDNCVLYSLGLLYYHGKGIKKDYIKAREYFERAIKVGDSRAQVDLDDLNIKEIYDKNLNEQIGELKKQADIGNSCAVNKLGLLYRDGIGFVVQDYSKAIEYFKKAAGLGNSDGLFNLGLLYYYGNGVKQNYCTAQEYYEKAAKLGNIRSFVSLGELYHYGHCVRQDFSRAREYYEKAIKLGNNDALVNLRELDKILNEKINEQIGELLKKADNGDDFSINRLGLIYRDGIGFVTKDYNKSIEYFEKAANFGNRESLNNLAKLYLDGKLVKQDYVKAREYYIRAAEMNDINALYNLGIIYENGLGIEKDYAKSLEYYVKVKQLGVLWNIKNDLERIDKLIKIPQEICKLEKLANDGDSKAANKLGLTYKNGIKLGLQYTIYPDYTKAREYFERAVELNNTAALVNLGELYENGLSVNKDYDTARCYYERAVELNNSQAFTRLGELYELGHGVMKNIDKAKQYYEKAIELGNSDALKNYINL
jgi:TPR repeat protein